tara:strand:- start:1758 stop:1970 length:213 start_codon:yes stop_codon:yes gene_type:complete
MKLKIEKNIALPPRKAGAPLVSLAYRMVEGDSVKVNKSQCVPLCQAIRRQGGQAAMRKIDDETWRVWRTK